MVLPLSNIVKDIPGPAVGLEESETFTYADPHADPDADSDDEELDNLSDEEGLEV